MNIRDLVMELELGCSLYALHPNHGKPRIVTGRSPKVDGKRVPTKREVTPARLAVEKTEKTQAREDCLEALSRVDFAPYGKMHEVWGKLSDDELYRTLIGLVIGVSTATNHD